MIETKDITKMVAHIVRRDAGIPDTTIMHPTREWVLGIFAVALFVILGVGFNVVLYRTYSAALTSEVPVTETMVPYKAAVVSQAINYYQAERAQYEAIIGVQKPVIPAVSPSAATSTESDIVIPPPPPAKPVATATEPITRTESLPEPVTAPQVDVLPTPVN